MKLEFGGWVGAECHCMGNGSIGHAFLYLHTYSHIQLFSFNASPAVLSVSESLQHQPCTTPPTHHQNRQKITYHIALVASRDQNNCPEQDAPSRESKSSSWHIEWQVTMTRHDSSWLLTQYALNITQLLLDAHKQDARREKRRLPCNSMAEKF